VVVLTCKPLEKVPDWENLRVVGRNKEPAHATLMPYPNEEEALLCEREKSSWFLTLNGEWKFKLYENPDSAPKDFYKPN